MLNEANQIIKEDVNIEVYCIIENAPIEVYQKAADLLQNATARREWLNKEPEQTFAYSCIPMTHASESGIWIVSDAGFNVFWNGDKTLESVVFNFDSEKEKNESLICATSHFPIGIVTFSLPFLFKTPPGWGLYVSGCPNSPINNLQALEAIVETNWLPFTFTMNYKITEPNKVIRIDKGTPICRIIPYPLNLNEKIRLSLKNLDQNIDLKNKWKNWSDSRESWNKSLRQGFSPKNKIKEKVPPYSNTLRQNFYRDGKDASENLEEYKGMHKNSYKVEKLSNSKCPFLNGLKKYKIL